MKNLTQRIIKPQLKVNDFSSIEIGTVLIAKPYWKDEVYHMSVILIVDKTYDGFTGIILNKPSNLTINDALKEIDYSTVLFFGGPIKKDTITFLHQFNDIPDSFRISDNLFFGGNYKMFVSKINGKTAPQNIRFSAGFVYWESGELRDEMLQGKWWLSKISPSDFCTHPGVMWSEKLLDENYMYGLFNYEPDPSSN